MKDKIKIIISSIIILIPAIVGFCVWDMLPDVMETSFDWNGAATGYSSKFFVVAGLPLLLLGANFVCIIATMADPKRKNISNAVFNIIICIVPVCSLFCGCVIYAKALNYSFNIESVMPVFVGIVFIIIGFFLPKCKQNYTVGIKLPWTLNDEENWNKTHKMAGPLWMVGGAVMTITGLLNLQAVFISVIIMLAAIPSVYSFILYKKK